MNANTTLQIELLSNWRSTVTGTSTYR